MRLKLASAACSVLLVAACDSADDAGNRLTIAATTGVAADIAANVAPAAEVQQLIPDGASPHDFELSAQDRHALDEADLVVAIGAGLETGIPLDDISAPVWRLSENAGDLLPFKEAGVHAGGHDSGHNGPEGEDRSGHDPHVWMDPTRVAAAIPSLAETLIDLGRGDAGRYRSAAYAYAAELDRLDAELQRQLATVPPHSRELVTSHDSLGYFADRYGFEVVATAFPASGPDAEPSAARLAKVAEAVRETGVPAVFAQREDDPEALGLVADQAGVAIEDDLLIESPATTETYVEMLRHDAEVITAALR